MATTDELHEQADDGQQLPRSGWDTLTEDERLRVGIDGKTLFLGGSIVEPAPGHGVDQLLARFKASAPISAAELARLVADGLVGPAPRDSNQVSGGYLRTTDGT